MAGVFAAALAALAGLASGDVQPSLEPVSIDPPAAPGSTSPAVATESVTTLREEHDVLMTWLEPGAAGRLKFARLVEQKWTPPITIAEGVSTLDPADRPSLIVLDTQAVRRTLIARTGDVVARSGDAGRTWTRLPSPTLPFASFAGGDEGGYAFWLDAGENGTARLLGTRILTGEALLDPSAAGGSGTSAAMTWDGPIVVYRDESAQDIFIVRRQDAQWTRPRPVHHVAGWRPAGKPKSGPEVAVLRRQVAVAWYTEAPHRPRVLVAFSEDAGRTFGAPVEVDLKKGDRTPLPFVDVDVDVDGHALVLWKATTGSAEAALKLARVSPDGRRRKGLVLAEELPRSGGIAQIVRAGDRVAASWIAGGRLRAVDVPLAAIAAPDRDRGESAAAAPKKPRGISAARGRTGEPAPDIELVSLDGDAVSLAALRGRPVLLNLWATWCMPCIAEIPELAALHERYGPQGLVMVGVNFDEAAAAERVRAFVGQREIPFAVWLDPEMAVYRKLRVKGLPVTLVVDREGRIVLRRDGTLTADDPEITGAIRRALGDS